MTSALVVMAYGTPASAADVEAYYTHIRRGRPPTADQLAELAGRYQAIGGVSPLAERTRAQADAIAAALEAAEPGEWQVALGHISDRIGREWVWTASSVGFIICYLALILLQENPSDFLLYVMIVAQGALCVHAPASSPLRCRPWCRRRGPGLPRRVPEWSPFPPRSTP